MGCRRNGVKVLVVQLATENAHWSATHAQSINLFYARRHSYDFTSYSCPTNITEDHMWDPNDQVRSNWAKPLIILKHLDDYDYVVMLDSDAYFTDPSVTIEEIVNSFSATNFSVLLPRNCMFSNFDKDSNNYICDDSFFPGIVDNNIL